jgi:hypothetical protein
MDGLYSLNENHLIAAARQEIVRDGNNAKVMTGLTRHGGEQLPGSGLAPGAGARTDRARLPPEIDVQPASPGRQA